MKSLISLALFLASVSVASAACSPDDTVTYGASVAAPNGQPYVAVEGVGITIERRGLTVTSECDPIAAQEMRTRLLGELHAGETFTPDTIPVWLQN